jgi:DNA-binding HxlR family transcriptional regulator
MNPKKEIFEAERQRILGVCLGVVSHEIKRRILYWLLENGGLSYSDILQKIKISSPRLAKSLRELGRTPLIDRYYDPQDTGCYSFYRLTEFGKGFMKNLTQMLKDGSPDNTRSPTVGCDSSTFTAGTNIFANTTVNGTHSMNNATVQVGTICTATATLYANASQFLINSATINFIGQGHNKNPITIETSITYDLRSEGGSQDDKDIDFIGIMTQDGEEGVA